MLSNFKSPQDAALVKGGGATYSQSKILVGRRPRQQPWLIHREVLKGRSLTGWEYAQYHTSEWDRFHINLHDIMLGSSEKDYVGSIFPCSCLKTTRHLALLVFFTRRNNWVHAKTNQSTCFFRAKSMSTTTRSQSGMSRPSKLLRTFGGLAL